MQALTGPFLDENEAPVNPIVPRRAHRPWNLAAPAVISEGDPDLDPVRWKMLEGADSMTTRIVAWLAIVLTALTLVPA